MLPESGATPWGRRGGVHYCYISMMHLSTIDLRQRPDAADIPVWMGSAPFRKQHPGMDIACGVITSPDRAAFSGHAWLPRGTRYFPAIGRHQKF